MEELHKNCAEQVPRLPKGYKIPKKTEMPLINTRDPMLNQTLTILPFFLFSPMQMLMDIGTQKMTTLPTDDKMNKVPHTAPDHALKDQTPNSNRIPKVPLTRQQQHVIPTAQKISIFPQIPPVTDFPEKPRLLTLFYFFFPAAAR